MKLPRLRPTTSNCAVFCCPPVDSWRTDAPPTSSAMSGARFFASRTILAALPAIVTVSLRCSLGLSGDASAWRSSARKVIKKLAKAFFAQEILTAAAPGSRSAGGRRTKEVGDEASTTAEWPPMLTALESASPQKPCPATSKRSASEAIRGADATLAFVASVVGEMTVVGTRPGRPAMEPKMIPGSSGATNNARPDWSVL